MVGLTDGADWRPLGRGFPTGEAVGRVGLAAAPSNPGVIYALVVDGRTQHVLGVWRYDGADDAWRPVAGHPERLFGPDPNKEGQGWYDLAIAVDPRDENRL